MKLDWLEFKEVYDSRKLDITMINSSDSYKLVMGDSGVEFICNLVKEISDDIDDFETNYKSLCNQEKPKIQQISATTPANEHCMQPWGCEKGYFKSKNDLTTGDYVCAVTLSDKSLDGLTFTYNSDIPITPAIGNYIFQKECSKRSWITSFDTVNHTLTVELPHLDNGVGIYSKGYYTDSLVRDWAPAMYLWGLTLNVLEYEGDILEDDPCCDLIELSIVDIDDLFKTDIVCQALFGVDASEAAPYLIAMGFEDNQEYGHWTKYYDESWIISCNGMYTPAPDGSPGELLPGLYLRLSFFTTENEEHDYHIFADYYPTSKT